MDKIWSGNVKDDNVRDAVIKYLNCPCRCFSPMEDDYPLMNAYTEALERGKTEGFIPIIVVYDEILLESLTMNVDAENEDYGEKYGFDLKAVSRYREEALNLSLMPGRAALAQIMGVDELKKEDIDIESIDESDAYEDNNRFCGYWDCSEEMTKPVILAEIPVRKPWEVFAYLPFGGWNECPDTPQLMSVIKYWNEKYGAVPAVLTYDVLELTVPKPVSDKRDAAVLAWEQSCFCSDIVFQGVGTVPALANLLTKSSVWYFWWD